jgi:hypothetical protein
MGRRVFKLAEINMENLATSDIFVMRDDNDVIENGGTFYMATSDGYFNQEGIGEVECVTGSLGELLK